MAIRIVDVTDLPSFELVPPCADPAFDHRTCDYWEDAARGSKAARAAWLEAPTPPPARPRSNNPFLDPNASAAPPVNPFAPPAGSRPAFNPFADGEAEPAVNPFAPPPPPMPVVESGAPRKLQLLARGLAIFGSYARVLLVDDEPAAYAQYGPLSAYPRAQRVRELYPQLPAAPLPAVITCIATTTAVRQAGHARRLIEAVCEDLAGRGFTAVEAYPEPGARADATSAARPEFWLATGFALAVDDERYPVVRREL